MKMIDVLNLQAESKIDFGAKLTVPDRDDIFEYIDYRDGSFIDEYGFEIDVYYTLDKDFLNLEVELILPIPKEYQLRLYKEDDLSYVVRSSYNSDFNYDLGSKSELCEFTTKFTQEEIDNDKFLKFIERHGVKEEVEE